jgi:hypothetical protein
MARMRVSGAELELKENLSRDMIRRMVEAGGKVADDRMKAATRAHMHVRTGDMLEAIKPTPYREWFGGGATEVYPQGDDRNGVRNATKAYVINYGRGRRKRNGKMGDKFITNDEKATEEAVRQAMEAENGRLIEEI